MTLYFIACVLGQFLQTAAGFGFGILVMAVAGMFLPVTAVASGYVTAEVLQMSAIGLVGAGVGLWLGLKVVDRLNIQLLRIIAYIIIGLSGLWMILNAWVL